MFLTEYRMQLLNLTFKSTEATHTSETRDVNEREPSFKSNWLQHCLMKNDINYHMINSVEYGKQGIQGHSEMHWYLFIGISG